MLIGIRPGDSAWVRTIGANYIRQEEHDTISFYEIQNGYDQIQIDLSEYITGLSDPVMVARTAFGPTDFTITDRESGDIVVSEKSGFDTDVWFVDISETSGKLTIGEFDTDDGVDGTQAAWYPYVTVAGVT